MDTPYFHGPAETMDVVLDVVLTHARTYANASLFLATGAAVSD